MPHYSFLVQQAFTYNTLHPRCIFRSRASVVSGSHPIKDIMKQTLLPPFAFFIIKFFAL